MKGYFRAALGLQKLENYEGALDFVKRGLGIESSNPDLKKMSRELEDTLRMKKVDNYIVQAEEQMKSDDLVGAYKTLDAAMRLEPNHSKLNKLMDNVRPKYERRERERVAQLDPKEKIKESADNYYKNANFEEAIKSYTKCIDSITDKSSELALKCFGNRAACFKQLSNFDGTIGDCTTVLEYKPDDVKSLIRRAQAYEACERYKSAMQDVRQVLAYGQDAVGKPTFDLANGMQHRLNKVIAQLKAC